MNIFVTGATGWIGSHLVPELMSAGHTVTGLARSDASADALAGVGAEIVRGDLADLDVLTMAANSADAVAHLAFVHDFSDFANSVQVDAAAIDALGKALAGSGRPLVVTTGTPAVPGRPSTERDVPAANSLAGGRGENATTALAFAGRDVRVSELRLPRSVHGTGDKGFVPILIDTARQSRVAGYVDDGTARWPAVHVTDAARLYRLALEHASAGSVLHAVGDEGVATRSIAETIGRSLGPPVGPRPADEFGFLGALLAVDQPASADATRAMLDWVPTGPSLLDDLDAGHYFTEARSVVP